MRIGGLLGRGKGIAFLVFQANTWDHKKENFPVFLNPKSHSKRVEHRYFRYYVADDTNLKIAKFLLRLFEKIA